MIIVKEGPKLGPSSYVNSYMLSEREKSGIIFRAKRSIDIRKGDFLPAGEILGGRVIEHHSGYGIIYMTLESPVKTKYIYEVSSSVILQVFSENKKNLINACEVQNLTIGDVIRYPWNAKISKIVGITICRSGYLGKTEVRLKVKSGKDEMQAIYDLKNVVEVITINEELFL